MRTIYKESIATYEIKKSKFIAHLIPIGEFKAKQESLKEAHPKARHIVYAMRYLNEFEQVVENSTDDKEPKGSAGVPALNVLRGEELINVAVLIVRYFGGIKLGIGGLIRAYGNAVKETISKAEIFSYEKFISYSFKTSYSNIQKTEYKLAKSNIDKVDREFLIDRVKWTIESTQDKIDMFKKDFS